MKKIFQILLSSSSKRLFIIYLLSLAFSPVSKPHTHITYMLRQCTSIVYLFSTYNDISIELYSDYNWVDHVYVTVTPTKFV